MTTYRIIRTRTTASGPCRTVMGGDYADREAAELNMGEFQLDDIAMIDADKVSYEIQEIPNGKAS